MLRFITFLLLSGITCTKSFTLGTRLQSTATSAEPDPRVPLVDNSRRNKPTTDRCQDVNFAAPLLDYGYPPTVQEFREGTLSEKPILLYLPGFDGTYICPFIQFPELGTEFEVWCMTVGMKDRSTFSELRQHVLDFIEKVDSFPTSTEESTDRPEKVVSVANSPPRPSFWANLFSTGTVSSGMNKRPIYLAGESFGGILASEVALSLLESPEANQLKGLVLINPATCYPTSALASQGPPVYQLPSLVYPFGLTRLLPLFSDEYSFEQLLLILQAKGLPSVIDTPARESYMGRVAFSLPTKLEYMGQGTLKWRLEEWLTEGSQYIEKRLRAFQKHPSFPTLILAGEKDLTLPSLEEAERLSKVLPKCSVHVVKDAGHASTCGSRVDLTALLRKTFKELQKVSRIQQGEEMDGNPGSKRTAMKPEAAAGTGAYLGMEGRYDGASIGLNPILYWSKENYQSVRTQHERVTTTAPDSGLKRQYKWTKYES